MHNIVLNFFFIEKKSRNFVFQSKFFFENFHCGFKLHDCEREVLFVMKIIFGTFLILLLSFEARGQVSSVASIISTNNPVSLMKTPKNGLSPVILGMLLSLDTFKLILSFF